MSAVLFRAAAAVCAMGLVGACAGGGSGAVRSGPIDETGGMPAGYSLVWSDEFDGSGLPNKSKWAYDVHANPTGWYNRELQYYANARMENSRLENGRLVIEARKESAKPFPDATGGEPQEYTSARLVTQGKASWTYGFFDVRAKLPCGQGSWPAIWTLADVSNLRWPYDGEIDLMEHINSADEAHFSVHTQAHNHTNNTQVTNGKSVVVCDGSFHNYQMTWTENEILLGMDGRNYLRYANEHNGRRQWPFDGPQYLLLNIAVGGDWPGNPGGATVFPLRMEVDYVRVYKRN